MFEGIEFFWPTFSSSSELLREVTQCVWVGGNTWPAQT